MPGVAHRLSSRWRSQNGGRSHSPRRPSFRGSQPDAALLRWTTVAAVAVTVLVGLVSSAGGYSPVSSGNYRRGEQVQRVSMWAE